MAEVVWTEPALADLDAIADYIAVENFAAASKLVASVFAHVEQSARFPESGRKPLELGKATRYRQIIEPPCRVFYRFDGLRVLILYVMRSERPLKARQLSKRARAKT